MAMAFKSFFLCASRAACRRTSAPSSSLASFSSSPTPSASPMQHSLLPAPAETPRSERRVLSPAAPSPDRCAPPAAAALQLPPQTDAACSLKYETPLKVLLYPDPRLRAKNKRITTFDENLENFAREMFQVMYRTDGVGLSAPQVGVNVQLMVFNPEGEKGKGEEIVLVNPRILKYSNKHSVFTEGCLSFPGMEADVERPIGVKIEAQDIKGKQFNIHLKGFQARVFQHEYDHLKSVLFFERMSPSVLNTIVPFLKKLEEDYEKKTGLRAPEKVNSKK